VGRAYELLRSDLQEHLRFLQKEFGYRYIRFHGSFHDDMAIVHEETNGEFVYRWTQLDHVYDFLVDAGFDPIVEINPMPTPLASGEDTFFWYKMNVTPPADTSEWERFLQAYIQHTVERYGVQRVRNWMFEVWNEPDLRNQFWTGSMQEYYQLYASCAKVLKAFDSSLIVGGPATANPSEALPFASWCRDHQVPLDFLSYHSYPQNEACQYASAEESPSKPGMHFVDVISATKADLAEAGFGDLPLIMTEWNTQSQGADWKAKWTGNETVNSLFAGAAVCHLTTACDSLLDVMGWWVASDVFEEGGPQVEPYGRSINITGCSP
jgi:xylan 1,4-beta-xylosidase